MRSRVIGSTIVATFAESVLIPSAVLAQDKPQVVLFGTSDDYPLSLGLGVLFSATPALDPLLGATQLPISRPEVALAGPLVALPIPLVFLVSQRFLVCGILAGGVKQ